MKDEFDTMSDEKIEELMKSESIKKLRALIIAEDEAREKAGIKGKAGRVEFICPNCNRVCVSNFYPHRGQLHGSMGCPTCKIEIRV